MNYTTILIVLVLAVKPFYCVFAATIFYKISFLPITVKPCHCVFAATQASIKSEICRVLSPNLVSKTDQINEYLTHNIPFL